MSKIDHNISLKLPDALIAATAIEQAATLVTRNAHDFDKLLEYGLLAGSPAAHTFGNQIGVLGSSDQQVNSP